MPELPEVETTLRGLRPYIDRQSIVNVVARRRQLRWPIPDDFEKRLLNQTIESLSRRGKYLLLQLQQETLMIHLGMSGRLCLMTEASLIGPHDHIDIAFSNHQILRYTDPRRFGAMLLTACPNEHPLLKSLGVEPLSTDLTTDYLLNCTKNRRMAIKSLLMNSHFIVGIGNIYAAEILFLAGIHPMMPAHALIPIQAARLIEYIQQVLAKAIAQGGTTLKDFVNSEGKPGYFSQQLNVYGRAGQACYQCGQSLQQITLGQRSTVFCHHCQIF